MIQSYLKIIKLYSMKIKIKWYIIEIDLSFVLLKIFAPKNENSFYNDIIDISYKKQRQLLLIAAIYENIESFKQ